MGNENVTSVAALIKLVSPAVGQLLFTRLQKPFGAMSYSVQPIMRSPRLDAPHGSNPGDSRFADRSLHYARSYMISTSVWVRAHPALPYM